MHNTESRENFLPNFNLQYPIQKYICLEYQNALEFGNILDLEYFSGALCILEK